MRESPPICSAMSSEQESRHTVDGHLIVVGSGDPALREYALAAMSRRVPVALLGYRRPTWEKPYVSAYASADLEDPEYLIREARKLFPLGMVTYDERLVQNTAQAAEALGLPGPGLDAVIRCKDKSRMRQRLAEADLSPVKFAVTHDSSAAAAAAASIGYPVVLKPRALSGSIGVVRVDDEAQLREYFDVAHGARVGLSAITHPGVLIEEYLDGPEYSVDAITHRGVTTPVVVAEKVLAFPPYFEEAGHIVPARTVPGLDEAIALVVRAHRAMGLDTVATHTEFRLTPRGPRIIELNARLGGDLIPYLGQLALGVDLPAAIADLAIGRTPVLTGTGGGVAAVGMCYPDEDVEVESVDLERPDDLPGLQRFDVLARKGETLRLPPHGFLSRLAAVVVTGADHDECAARLSVARSRVLVRGKRPEMVAATR
jgi:biotin carboxylase